MNTKTSDDITDMDDFDQTASIPSNEPNPEEALIAAEDEEEQAVTEAVVASMRHASVGRDKLMPHTRWLLTEAIAKLESPPALGLKASNELYYTQLLGIAGYYEACRNALPNSTEMERTVRVMQLLRVKMIEATEKDERTAFTSDFFEIAKAINRQALWQATLDFDKAERAARNYALGSTGAATDDTPVADGRDAGRPAPYGMGPEAPDFESSDHLLFLAEAGGWVNGLVSALLGPEDAGAMCPNGVPFTGYSVPDLSSPNGKRWVEIYDPAEAMEAQRVKNRESQQRRAAAQLAARRSMIEAFASL